MTSEWRQTNLGKIVKLLSGGTPSKARPDYWNGQIPWLSAKDMKSFWIEDTEDHLTEIGAGDATRIVPSGTTLLLVRGMTLHNDVPICRTRKPCAFNQDVKAVVALDGLDSEYLPYLLLANKNRLLDLVDFAGHGTGRLNTDTLLNLPVCIPSPQTQIQIANFVRTLDDKIEVNQRMNATLEAIALALFKSWLVDFDPVKAKAAGRPLVGIDAKTAAIFPSEFQKSELGLIPKGWEIKSLDQIATFLNGLALQKYPPDSEEEFLPVIKIAQLRRGDTEGSDKASRRMSTEYIVHDGDLLFSWSGSLEVVFWCGGEGALNQHLFKVFSSDYPRWLYYFWLKHHLPNFREIAADKATTMGHIQRRHLTEAKILVPSALALEKLTVFFDPLISKQIKNSIEARELANIRSALLPRLISGQIRIPDLEQVEGGIDE